MLVLYLPAFQGKNYTAYDRFHGNGPYDKIPTMKEPIRTLGFACHIILSNNPLDEYNFSAKQQRITD